MIDKIGDYFIRSLWVILETILYLFIALGLGLLLGYLMSLLKGDWIVDPKVIDPFHDLLFEYIPLLIGSLVALFVVHKLIFKRDFSLTGFISRDIGLGLSIGAIVAAVMLLLGFVALLLFGGIRIDAVDWNPKLFIGFLLFFGVQSTFEEVVSRAFLIPTIERRSNVWVALLISSLLFAWVHGSNPGVTWIGLINVFLAGLLLGILFIRYRSIWPPIGLHIAWNFLQGSFFGYEVSGFEVYSLLNTTEIGNDYITGGSFGYEGSILALFTLLIVSFWIYVQNPHYFSTLSIYSRDQQKEINDGISNSTYQSQEE